MNYKNNLFGSNIHSADRSSFPLHEQHRIQVGSSGLKDQFGNFVGTHRTFDTPSGRTHILRDAFNVETVHTVSNSIPGSSHGGYFVPNSDFMKNW